MDRDKDGKITSEKAVDEGINGGGISEKIGKLKIAFLGFGKMAEAMAHGILISGIVKPQDILVTGRNMEKLKDKARRFNVNPYDSNALATYDADIVFLTVKPDQYRDVADEINEKIKDGTIIISVAPGMENKKIKEMFPGKKIKPCVIMPNTPAMVGEGMTLMGPSPEMTPQDVEIIKNLLNSFGRTAIITDKMVNETGSLSGCTPAFTYMFIEALSDAGVYMGMDRKTAVECAAQTVLGAARMVLETGIHPGELKDMVTSPGGTTIRGVKSLEENGLRFAAMEAVLSARKENQK